MAASPQQAVAAGPQKLRFDRDAAAGVPRPLHHAGARRSLVRAASVLVPLAIGIAAEEPRGSAPVGAVLLSPTLGRPAFAPPAGSFPIVAQFSNAAPRVEASLRDRAGQSYSLALTPTAASGAGAFQATIPATVPEGVYSLEVAGGGDRLSAPHSVSVGTIGERVRLIHLSNMNIGDLGAPRFDDRLVDEINLLAPTLIIATGDYVDTTHPDPGDAWRQLVAFFSRFDAPVLMACGDHDNIADYSRRVAGSPIGLLDVAKLRIAVLYDHSGNPLEQDADQLAWIQRTLAAPGDAALTIIVSHGDFPSLLQVWESTGRLSEKVSASRLGAWIAGGSRDWDGREYRPLVDGATPLLYVRTHQSSTAIRGGSIGVSHYRVLDVAGGRISQPSDETAGARSPASLQVGRLWTLFDPPNDGSAAQVSFQLVNNHPVRLDRLAVSVRVRKAGPAQPWAVGATLESCLDRGAYWECRLRLDVPDRSALRALVGTGAAPAQPAVEARFAIEDSVELERQTTPDGVDYLAGPPLLGSVELSNSSASATELTPLIRLDGEWLAYRVRDREARDALGWRLRLAPGESVRLQPDWSAVRVNPGRRELQVFLREAPYQVPFCRSVLIRVRDAAAATRE